MDNQLDIKGSSKDISIAAKRQVQIEAISKAVYLVTDLLDSNEPIRISLRKVAIGLLESDDKKTSLSKIRSMLRLARDMSMISDMNATLLIEAVEKTQTIHEEKKEVSERVMGDVLKASESVEVKEEYKEPSRVDRLERVEKPVISRIDVQRVSAPQKTDIVQYEKQVVTSRERTTTMSVPALDIGSRRKKILEVVRSKGQATINEFIESIQGCSSKTIQRELTSLVLSGTLKKTGERRWSKYSIR